MPKRPAPACADRDVSGVPEQVTFCTCGHPHARHTTSDGHCSDCACRVVVLAPNKPLWYHAKFDLGRLLCIAGPGEWQVTEAGVFVKRWMEVKPRDLVDPPPEVKAFQKGKRPKK